MFIYNVTIKVDWNIHNDWLEWMKKDQIPEMLSSGHFHNFQFVRLVEVEEDDGPTYAIQYYTNTKRDYENYVAALSATVNQQVFRKWGDHVVMFETLMEVIN